MSTRAPGGGRKPQPTALKLLRGNPGKGPINREEPAFSVRLPAPPAELTARAKNIWRRDGKQLLEAGVFTRIDIAAFAAFCVSYARWLDCQRELTRAGSVIYKDASGNYALHPLLKVARDAQAEFLRVASEFGMTPAMRTRIRVGKADDTPIDREWWDVG